MFIEGTPLIVEIFGFIALLIGSFVLLVIAIYLVFGVVFNTEDTFVLTCSCGRKYGERKPKKLKRYENDVPIFGGGKRPFVGVTWLKYRWHKAFQCK